MNVTIDRLIENTRTLCVTRLAAPDLHHLTERLSAITGTTGFWQLTSHIQELESSHDRVRLLKTRLAEDGDLSRRRGIRTLPAAGCGCARMFATPDTAGDRPREGVLLR